MYIGFRGSIAADLSDLNNGVLRVLIHFSRLQLIKLRGKDWILEFTPASNPEHPFIARKHASEGSYYCRTAEGAHLWIYLGSESIESEYRGGYGSVNPRDGGSGYLKQIQSENKRLDTNA